MKDYKPTCPRGYTDCIWDPAYIKAYSPEWYSKIYGRLDVMEAAEECRRAFIDDPDENEYCYDNEDK